MIGKNIEVFLGVEDGKKVYITGIVLDKVNVDGMDRYIIERPSGHTSVVTPHSISRIIKNDEEEIKF